MKIISCMMEGAGVGGTLGGAIAAVTGASVEIGGAVGVLLGAGLGTMFGIWESEAAESSQEEYCL